LRTKSLINLLSEVFPENSWFPWKFENYWNIENNKKIFLEWAKNEFKIKEMSDWYNVTNKVFVTVIFSS
jgi:hypothetical protein